MEADDTGPQRDFQGDEEGRCLRGRHHHERPRLLRESRLYSGRAAPL